MDLLFFELFDRFGKVTPGRFLELSEPNIAEIVDDLRFHAFNFDGVPDEGEDQGIRCPVPLNGEIDLAPFRPAHLLDGVHQRQILRGVVVDFSDEIPGLDSSSMRGRTFDRRYHGQPVVLHTDLNADSSEFSPGFDLHFLIHFRRHIR